MRRLLAVARVVVFVVTLVAASAVAYQTIHTWRLLCLSAGSHATANPHYYGFTSAWTFFFPSLLAAATVALGGFALLRDRQSAHWVRIVYEIAYVAFALYTFHVLWRTLYQAYDPNHSGPFL